MCDLLRINIDRGVMLHDGQSRFSKDGKPIYHFVGTSTFSEYTVCHSGCVTKINPQASLDKFCVLSCGISTELLDDKWSVQTTIGIDTYRRSHVKDVCFNEFGGRVRHWSTLWHSFAVGGYDNRCILPFHCSNNIESGSACKATSVKADMYFRRQSDNETTQLSCSVPSREVQRRHAYKVV